ncbi:unnamed protein product [Paramecium pentaurelia]|uniref:Uncharacterized protein n=1 Tax=Paramecium pentaurelia TaxID=43138 RepID=A0A8S1T0A4_9CILI|nr:unnamed protein product [Paramecium pentaurelia]
MKITQFVTLLRHQGLKHTSVNLEKIIKFNFEVENNICLKETLNIIDNELVYVQQKIRKLESSKILANKLENQISFCYQLERAQYQQRIIGYFDVKEKTQLKYALYQTGFLNFFVQDNLQSF